MLLSFSTFTLRRRSSTAMLAITRFLRAKGDCRRWARAHILDSARHAVSRERAPASCALDVEAREALNLRAGARVHGRRPPKRLGCALAGLHFES